MMHNNKLVLAIKHNGSILREITDNEGNTSVFVPFGAEYSLYFKNLHTVRAQVRVSIDGSDALDGESLVLNANEPMDLERFIKSGNLSRGNKFKFIERTGDIEQHRGIKAEDGLIRCEYQFEYVPAYQYPHIGTFTNAGGPYWNASETVYGNSGSNIGVRCKSSILRSSAQATSVTANAATAPVNNVGITTQGDISNQQFRSVAGFALENTKHVIVLRLLGEMAGSKIEQPITVKSKQKCNCCGRLNKSGAKFCTNCGTCLIVV